MKIEKYGQNMKFFELNFVTNSIRTVQLKNWSIWTYSARVEAFLPKISLFTKIEVDRDQ